MPIKVYRDDTLQNHVWELIDTLPEFDLLKEFEIKIVACMREKTDGEGNPIKGDPSIKVIKVSDVFKGFVKADVMILVDAVTYNSHEERLSQDALVHKGLALIDVIVVEKEDKEPEVKVKIKKPEVVESIITLERYGRKTESCILIQALRGTASSILCLPGLNEKSTKDKANEPEPDNGEPEEQPESEPVKEEPKKKSKND